MAEDDFDAKSAAFKDWLLAQPLAEFSDKISLADLRDRDAGRGVVAVADIDEDESLFTVPRTCVLSTARSDLSEKLPHPEYLDDAEPWVGLVLVLIYEYLRGDESHWKPYLDLLPATFDTLMFWSDEELAELQASTVRDKIGKDEADEMFAEDVLPVIKECPDVFYPDGVEELDDEALMKLAHRMGSAVMAYSFDLIKTDADYLSSDDSDADETLMLYKAMIPMADMLNADADHNARLILKDDETSQSLCMRATRAIKKGEELLNDYGPLPRSDLLRRYGYTTPQYEKYDVVEVSQSQVLSSIRAFADLDAKSEERGLAFLNAQGCLEDGYLLRRGPSAQSYGELLPFVVTLLAREDKFNQFALAWEGCRTAHSDAADGVVRHMAEARLREYATSVAEDRAILAEEGIGHRRRMAVEVRLAEKEILTEVIANATRAGVDADDAAGGLPDSKRRKLNE